LPVERVSWLDAVEFCNRLSETEKLTPCYRLNGDKVTVLGGGGYRLPTEAEWEYACRAGNSTLWPFGDDPDMLGEYAWYDKDSAGKTHAAGQKRANSWGLHDMLGNVWEWCADGYDAKYYASSPPADPTGATEASVRVHRGGSWLSAPRYARSATRHGSAPGSRISPLGFRLARGQSGR
jgi:formylglycine-generating enzyme required for sulfatase activity